MKELNGSYWTKDELFIEADPTEIYKVLVDFNNRHLWWKANRGKVLNGGEIREGSRVAIFARHGIFPIRFLMRIQRLEAPYRIRMELEKGPIRGICEWQVEPRDDGALVRLVWERVRPYGVPAKLLFALTGDRNHRRHTAEGLAGLKAYLMKTQVTERK